MDFILGKKLYSDSTLKSLHSEYLNCVEREVTKAFESGVVKFEELCLNEKKNYYNHLHDQSKIEHDNVIRYFRSVRKFEG